MISKYYVKVALEDIGRFDEHMKRNNILADVMVTTCFGKGENHVMYAINMDPEHELILKLAFPLIGCMNFQKTIGRQIKQTVRE